jgi:dihydrofolate synthase / folylpolyglutamate synthase
MHPHMKMGQSGLCFEQICVNKKMNYTETIEYLYRQMPMFHRIGAAAYKANLDNTHALDQMFGAQHSTFKSIHVAGTNGKGSVSHMLASILQCAGYKVGLYTSPHLKDFRERIRINGQMITEDAVVAFMEKYLECNKEFNLNPSFFELTVAMAFDYFSTEQIDVAVVEVGLGGRLDSTNIITPQVSVITNISFDHTNLLGNTLEKIAFEKAGIIKPGIPVVVGETTPETKPVFHAKANECGSEIVFAETEVDVLKTKPTAYNAKLGNTVELNNIVLGLKGNYQQKNLATVMASILALRKKGFHLTEAAIRNGLETVVEQTQLLGRWQTLQKNPLVICDTGHNEAGIRFITEQLTQTPHNKLHMVIGMVNDKDVRAMLLLLPNQATYYFAKARVERALDAETLKNLATEYGLNGTAYATVAEAYRAALLAATPNDLIFIGGSTFVVAEVV